MKRLVRRVLSGRALAIPAVLTLAAVGLLATVGDPAGAAPISASGLVAAAGTATCPSYPFGPGPTVSISTTDPFPGETVTIRGANFDKNAHVSTVLSPPGTTLASVSTGSTGAFTERVTIPTGATGSATISVVGGAPAACPPNTMVIHVQTTVVPPSGGGSLASTGVDILVGLLVALLLLSAGLFLTRTGRRRHQPAHSAR